MVNHTSHPDIAALDAIDRSTLPADGGTHYNRLIFESSPYLLQHAVNPVDWYPWGETALARARSEEKPIFLSIGYATCHWCHVMAAESFADPTVAAVLARHFVAIKVDREERPDLDHQYMTACQLMTGSGGWPLTLLLDPECRPFFAATYLPRTSRGGQVGLVELLEQVAELWRTQRAMVFASGERVTAVLSDLDQGATAAARLEEHPLRRALANWRTGYDGRHAGFGGAPSSRRRTTLLCSGGWPTAWPLPMPGAWPGRPSRPCVTAGSTTRSASACTATRSTPPGQIPHFEKMLYDQALFVQAALDGFQATGDADFAAQARDTVTYLLRDLRTPQGGFCCGEDADSEGEEGAFYLWTPAQVHDLLPIRPGRTCLPGLRDHRKRELRGTHRSLAGRHCGSPGGRVRRQRGGPWRTPGSRAGTAVHGTGAAAAAAA